MYKKVLVLIKYCCTYQKLFLRTENFLYVLFFQCLHVQKNVCASRNLFVDTVFYMILIGYFCGFWLGWAIVFTGEMTALVISICLVKAGGIDPVGILSNA